ncbi:tRNA (5-methoxyuridine) 34 synthase [Methylophaga frappieri]|uniref:tRNA U34 carboxymethyltransferase n=1 Tax=Methylophaga frappieri (strain ATCC BAA-2434 / DSM 25690 / JAM7) TaxID=754477 RepID=I1YEP0_METFJ|nr:tRNA 5-methoxyuridine(34)/uridine 5-oxyacetic acid(34) synthase CmoB [Methylophaga frappieri]AFJ01383.1 tRNA (5-methoxyuridine) 34 synthase [Methylophaga frappieri]
MTYQLFYDWLGSVGQTTWQHQLAQYTTRRLSPEQHGKLPEWQAMLKALPVIKPSEIKFDDVIQIGNAADVDAQQREQILAGLKLLLPWRKGPYQLFDIEIDTEWRSDWKWQRLKPHIQPLSGRAVLDIGGGNGYHGWRMVEEGAQMVMGIDPTWLFVMQYQLMQHFIQSERHFVFPLGIEHMPPELALFDTVFSMGVLYHRRSPIDHLMECRQCLRSGGELVLETLVVPGEAGYALMPENRYARMRNVWFIPSVDTLIQWLTRCGFQAIRCVDVSPTSLAEQRRTSWMPSQSLADFLTEDGELTVEGYPAPLRAIIVANSP